MARYGLLWMEIAREYLASLPTETRGQVRARIEELLESPRQSRDGYDELTDQWTTIYGAGAGLIVCAVVHERERVIICDWCSWVLMRMSDSLAPGVKQCCTPGPASTAATPARDTRPDRAAG